VYLHVGAPKTGTTYVQDLLWKNRDALREGGLYVPGERQLDHFHFERDVRDDPQPVDHPEERWEGKLDRMADEISAEGAAASVISAERLCAATPRQVAKVMDRFCDFDVRVIYGTRDLASLLCSEWQESVKFGNRRTFHEWLDDMRAHDGREWFWKANAIESVLENWSYGDPNRVCVVTFPPPGAPVDEVWTRFAEALGWGEPVETVDRRPNESLGLVEATLVSRIQGRIPAGIPYARRLAIMRAEVAGRILAQRDHPLPILIPQSHRGWIADDTQTRIDYLEKSGFGIVGELADLVDSDSRFGDATADGHEREMLDASVDVIAELVAKLVHEWQRADRLQGQLDERHRPAYVQALVNRVPPNVRARLKRT
jgi:hypothetical protein